MVEHHLGFLQVLYWHYSPFGVKTYHGLQTEGQRDGRTEGQTEGRHLIAIAQLNLKVKSWANNRNGSLHCKLA